MWRGVRWYLVGSLGLGVLGALAGCSGGNYFAEREPWRHQAEAQCINSGAIHEGAGKVRITAINGPGMCGADFPLKVSSLGEMSPLGYGDELRPPGAIPNASSAPPRWPVKQPPPAPAPSYEPTYEPAYEPNYSSPPPAAAYPSQYPSPAARQYEAPISLDPPSEAASGPTYQPYDFRKPFGGSPPPPPSRGPVAATARRQASPAYDLSPVPYEKRRVIGEDGSDERYDPAAETQRVLQRQPAGRQPAARAAEPAPVVPLGPSRGPEVAAGGPVSVSPTATLACPLVSVLDHWISESVQPAAMRWFGQPVVEIKQISAYSCRGMNGDPNAHISEHAFGNALDIAAFIFVDGHKLTVEKGWHGSPEEQGFLRDVQGAACNDFTTVLAPGSNRFHYNHIHVDLMRRKGGRRACNPKAVSGEEIAARARGTYAAKHGDYTGSIGKKRKTSQGKRVEPFSYAEQRPDRDLPLAQPGADGED